jgi:hypothetical protein
MSVPTLAFLKDQASRLTAYMGDKHRFRLRAASALEAVAAMYRQADWNTLQALSARDERPYSASNSSVSALTSRPLCWDELGEPFEWLCEADWYRHSAAVGGAKETRTRWLTEHFVFHRDNGGAGVFLNADESLLAVDVRSEMQADGTLVNLRDPRGAVLNLMDGYDAHEIASLLCAVLLRRDEATKGPDFYVQYANYIFTVVVGALQTAGTRVSLPTLVKFFGPGCDVSLRQLSSTLPTDALAKKELDVFLESHTGNKGCLDNTWNSVYRVVFEALQRLNRCDWARRVFSDSPSARGLNELLQAGSCLLVVTAEDADGLPEVAFCYAMRNAMAVRLSLPSEAREPGWVFGLGEMHRYCRPPLMRMFEQGRSARVALLCTLRDSSVRAHSARELVADYARNQLHLDGCSRARLLEIAEGLANRPMLVQPGRLATLG